MDDYGWKGTLKGCSLGDNSSSTWRSFSELRHTQRGWNQVFSLSTLHSQVCEVGSPYGECEASMTSTFTVCVCCLSFQWDSIISGWIHIWFKPKEGSRFYFVLVTNVTVSLNLCQHYLLPKVLCRTHVSHSTEQKESQSSEVRAGSYSEGWV